jgi:hypothetical protein
MAEPTYPSQHIQPVIALLKLAIVIIVEVEKHTILDVEVITKNFHCKIHVQRIILFIERAQQAPLTVPTPLANLEFIKKVMLKTARAGIVA